MTDYTPWEVGSVSQKTENPNAPVGPFYYVFDQISTICDLYIDIGPSFFGFHDAKERAQLIASAPRIKQEHAELLEALDLAVRIIPRAWMPAAPVTYAEWDSAFEKIDAILEKVKCS